MTNGFSIVLLNDDPLGSASLISQALAAARQVPVIDVAREARSCWGLLGENRPEDETRRVVAALHERGLDAEMVLTEKLPALAGIQAGRKIQIEDGGFRCQLSRGTTPLVPWSAVLFVSAAIIKSSTVTTETKVEGPSKSEKLVRMSLSMATGIPIPGARSRSVQVRKETTSLSAVLDIALAKPPGRLRMDADNLDATYLGERRAYDSLGNFKLVVADAASRVPDVDRNHGARVILTKGNISKMGYDSLKELEREERWMMARRALR